MTSRDAFKTKYASVPITVAIVLMLILTGPADAVRMVINVDNNAPTQGDEITFSVTANITGTDRYVPMENFSLLLLKDGSTVRNVEFAPDGTILSDNTGINITAIAAPNSTTDYGFGSRYATGNIYGYGYGSYNYGYGYGFAANNGAGSGTVVYEYNVTINTSSFDIGEYDAQILLNTGSSDEPSFTSLKTSFTVHSKKADVSKFIEANGTVNTTFTVTSAEGNVNLTVPINTVARDANNKPLTNITIGTMTSNTTMNQSLGASESVVGKAVTFGPEGATFEPSISIILSYEDSDLRHIDEKSLGVKYYNDATDNWDHISAFQNYGDKYFTVEIGHFSTYAIVGTEITTDNPGSSSGSSGGSGGGYYVRTTTEDNTTEVDDNTTEIDNTDVVATTDDSTQPGNETETVSDIDNGFPIYGTIAVIVLIALAVVAIHYQRKRKE